MLNLTAFVRGGRFCNPSQKMGSLPNNLGIKIIYLAPLHKSNGNRFPEVYRKLQYFFLASATPWLVY
jgi:hypothetical protein